MPFVCIFCGKQLTQASFKVVVWSGTEAVPAFADGLQGSKLPRTVITATQAFPKLAWNVAG